MSKNDKKCKICGWVWESRKEGTPKACPRCKRYDWDNPKSIHQSGEDKEVTNIK